MYSYHSMLDPNLYDNEFVANFVDGLSEPEVNSTSEELLNILKQEMMATDDISMLIESLLNEAKEKIISSGTLAPQFISYTDQDHKVRFELEMNIPTKSKQINKFFAAGKALSMIKSAQCTFFSTMQPLKDGFPAVGKEVDDDCPWGIFIIGSSLRGNCFVQLHQIIRNSSDICFNSIHEKIMREGQYAPYPFSRFFHINDEEEMSRIISQIPKLMMRSNMSEQECIVNFATTLKALNHFGYC